MGFTQLASLFPPEETEEKRPYTDFVSNKYDIVSRVAYLIGVEKRHFENEHEPPKLEVYEELDKDKAARIVRNLCIVRNAFERNYGKLITAFTYDLKNIGSVPDLIPTAALDELSKNRITLYMNRPNIDQYIITINKELSNRIASCQKFFPEWIKWNYIRDLFIMPNGMKPEGIKAAGMEYKANPQRYPYQVYINWSGGDNGNILYSDKKFVTLLYENHEDYFEDVSLVSGAGDITNANIYDFIEESTRLTVVVDCENSDPVKLAAFLSSLSVDQQGKITKVMLFDSDYTTSGWSVLSKIPGLPFERIIVKRLVESKSQVDMTLAARTCKEVYTNGVDSVILVSSDSDYWALIQTLSDVDFMVMVEREKCGTSIKNALDSQNIIYCYLDDFCTSASYKIKTTALIEDIKAYLKEQVSFNVNEMLNTALRNTWVEMTTGERNNFYDRYIRHMKLVIDADGNVSVELDNL